MNQEMEAVNSMNQEIEAVSKMSPEMDMNQGIEASADDMNQGIRSEAFNNNQSLEAIEKMQAFNQFWAKIGEERKNQELEAFNQFLDSKNQECIAHVNQFLENEAEHKNQELEAFNQFLDMDRGTAHVNHDMECGIAHDDDASSSSDSDDDFRVCTTEISEGINDEESEPEYLDSDAYDLAGKMMAVCMNTDDETISYPGMFHGKSYQDEEQLYFDRIDVQSNNNNDDVAVYYDAPIGAGTAHSFLPQVKTMLHFQVALDAVLQYPQIQKLAINQSFAYDFIKSGVNILNQINADGSISLMHGPEFAQFVLSFKNFNWMIDTYYLDYSEALMQPCDGKEPCLDAIEELHKTTESLYRLWTLTYLQQQKSSELAIDQIQAEAEAVADLFA